MNVDILLHTSIYEPTTRLIMPKKLTTEEFISRAKEIHGDKYDYSKSIYVAAKVKVIINCHIHGDFEQIPDGHLSGRGCRKCASIKQAESQKMSTREFISRATKIHNGKYDYSKSLLTGTKSKVEITCPEHGDFFQKAECHLAGYGCEKCAIDKRILALTMSTEQYIEKAFAVHGGVYDYSLVDYSRTHNKIKIICKTHGEFSQRASQHLLGAGCPSCKLDTLSDIFSDTKQTFSDKAKAKHGNKYDYSDIEYKNSQEKIVIICRRHGAFEQTPGSHLAGSGCPSCAEYGFNTGKDGYVYFLISDRGIKVGITNKPSQRIKKLTQHTPFDFHLIAKVKTTGAEAMRKEKYYHDKYESAGLTGFDGATEWLRYSPELMNEIMNENPAL